MATIVKFDIIVVLVKNSISYFELVFVVIFITCPALRPVALP